MNNKKLMKSKQKNKNNFMIPLIMFTLGFVFTVFLFAILSLFGIWDTLDQIFIKRNIINTLATKVFSSSQILVDFPGFLVIVLLFYNFLNVYKCMTLVLSYSLSQYISSILQLMFNDIDSSPLAYSNSCSNFMGNPNRKSIISVTMYLTLWQTLLSSSVVKNRKRIRTLLLIIIIEIIILINLINLFSQNYAFHQIFFGAVLGLFIYCFMFEVLRIDMNNPKQFFAFVDTKWYWIMALNSVFGALLVLSSKIHALDDEIILERLQSTVLKSCETFTIMPNTDSSNNRLKEELIINASIIFINIGFYIGLNLERRYFFENNTELFGKFNFNGYDEKSTSFASEIIVTKNNQWNTTLPFISIIRLIVGFVVCGGLLAFFMYVIVALTDNFYLFLFNVIVFSNVMILVIVFFLKIALKKMRLINMKIYQVPLLIVHSIAEVDEDDEHEHENEHHEGDEVHIDDNGNGT